MRTVNLNRTSTGETFKAVIGDETWPSWSHNFQIIEVPDDVSDLKVEHFASGTVFMSNLDNHNAPPVYRYADLGGSAFAV